MIAYLPLAVVVRGGLLTLVLAKPTCEKMWEPCSEEPRIKPAQMCPWRKYCVVL
jgi:hypothetical protein